jgi:hypothetical protein
MIAGVFVGLDGELAVGIINLAEIVDAGIRLGTRPGFGKIGDGDGGQQPNDRHNNHDFHKRESQSAM